MKHTRTPIQTPIFWSEISRGVLQNPTLLNNTCFRRRDAADRITVCRSKTKHVLL